MKEPCIIIINGNRKGEVFPLLSSGMLIGSASGATCRPAKEGIAPRHAKLIQDHDNCWYLYNMSENYRTEVDAQPLKLFDKCRLSTGAVLKFGDELEMVFQDKDMPSKDLEETSIPFDDEATDIDQHLALTDDVTIRSSNSSGKSRLSKNLEETTIPFDDEATDIDQRSVHPTNVTNDKVDSSVNTINMPSEDLQESMTPIDDESMDIDQNSSLPTDVMDNKAKSAGKKSVDLDDLNKKSIRVDKASGIHQESLRSGNASNDKNESNRKSKRVISDDSNRGGGHAGNSPHHVPKASFSANADILDDGSDDETTISGISDVVPKMDLQSRRSIVQRFMDWLMGRTDDDETQDDESPEKTDKSFFQRLKDWLYTGDLDEDNSNDGHIPQPREERKNLFQRFKAWLYMEPDAENISSKGTPISDEVTPDIIDNGTDSGGKTDMGKIPPRPEEYHDGIYFMKWIGFFILLPLVLVGVWIAVVKYTKLVAKSPHSWNAIDEKVTKTDNRKISDYYIGRGLLNESKLHVNGILRLPAIRFQLLKDDPILTPDMDNYGLKHHLVEDTGHRIVIKTKMGEDWQVDVRYIVDMYDSSDYLACTLDEGYRRWCSEHTSLMRIISAEKVSWLKNETANDGVATRTCEYERDEENETYFGILVFFRFQKVAFVFQREIAKNIHDFEEWKQILRDTENCYIGLIEYYWSCDMPLEEWRCHDVAHKGLFPLSAEDLEQHVKELKTAIENIHNSWGTLTNENGQECLEWPLYKHLLDELCFHTSNNEKYSSIYSQCLDWLYDFKVRQVFWFQQYAAEWKKDIKHNPERAQINFNYVQEVFKRMPSDIRNDFLSKGRWK